MRRTIYALILALVLPACDGIERPEQDGKGGVYSGKGELRSLDAPDAALQAELDACSEEDDEGVAANCVEDVLAVFGATSRSASGQAAQDGGGTGVGTAQKTREL